MVGTWRCDKAIVAGAGASAEAEGANREPRSGRRHPVEWYTSVMNGRKETLAARRHRGAGSMEASTAQNCGEGGGQVRGVVPVWPFRCHEKRWAVFSLRPFECQEKGQLRREFHITDNTQARNEKEAQAG